MERSAKLRANLKRLCVVDTVCTLSFFGKQKQKKEIKNLKQVNSGSSRRIHRGTGLKLCGKSVCCSDTWQLAIIEPAQSNEVTQSPAVTSAKGDRVERGATWVSLGFAGPHWVSLIFVDLRLVRRQYHTHSPSSVVLGRLPHSKSGIRDCKSGKLPKLPEFTVKLSVH